jgi:hypothetical protein
MAYGGFSFGDVGDLAAGLRTGRIRGLVEAWMWTDRIITGGAQLSEGVVAVIARRLWQSKQFIMT